MCTCQDLRNTQAHWEQRLSAGVDGLDETDKYTIHDSPRLKEQRERRSESLTKKRFRLSSAKETSVSV